MAAEAPGDRRHGGHRLRVVHAGRAEHRHRARRLAFAPSYRASTTEHSRRSSSWFSAPIRTVTPWSIRSRTRVTTTNWCSSSSRRRATVSPAVNASRSAAIRLAPPTKTDSAAGSACPGRPAPPGPGRPARRWPRLRCRRGVGQVGEEGVAELGVEGRRGRCQAGVVGVLGPAPGTGARSDPLDRTATTRTGGSWRRTSWTLRTLGAVDLGPHHHGGMVGDPRQQQAGLVEHVLQGVMGAGEEAVSAWRAGTAVARAGQVVHEEAVALVGRDPAGRGVGVGDVALPLEDRHLVAHRGRGNVQRRRCAATVLEPTGWPVSTYSSMTALQDGGFPFVHGVAPADKSTDGGSRPRPQWRRMVAALASSRPVG